MKLVLKFNLQDPKLRALIAHSREHYHEQRKCWPNTKTPLRCPSLMVVKDDGAYLMSPFPLEDGEPASLRARAHNKDGGLLVVYAEGCTPDDEWIGGDDFGEVFDLPEIRDTDTGLTITLTEKSMTIRVTGPTPPQAAPENPPGTPKITAALLEAFKRDVETILATIGEKHGVTVKFGKGTYTALNATLKLEVGAGVGENAVSKDRAYLLTNFAVLGLTRAQLDQPFKVGSTTYVLDGYRPRAAKPYIVRKPGVAEGRWILDEATVRRCLLAPQLVGN